VISGRRILSLLKQPVDPFGGSALSIRLGTVPCSLDADSLVLILIGEKQARIQATWATEPQLARELAESLPNCYVPLSGSHRLEFYNFTHKF